MHESLNEADLFSKAFSTQEEPQEDFVYPQCSNKRTLTKSVSTFICKEVPRFLIFEIQKSRENLNQIIYQLSSEIKQDSRIELHLPYFLSNNLSKKVKYKISALSKRFSQTINVGHWKNYTWIGDNYFEFDDDKVFLFIRMTVFMVLKAIFFKAFTRTYFHSNK